MERARFKRHRLRPGIGIDVDVRGIHPRVGEQRRLHFGCLRGRAAGHFRGLRRLGGVALGGVACTFDISSRVSSGRLDRVAGCLCRLGRFAARFARFLFGSIGAARRDERRSQYASRQ